ncbi:MAG: hypothetical protein AAFN77_10340 [Planctomycetota bacterium]
MKRRSDKVMVDLDLEHLAALPPRRQTTGTRFVTACAVAILLWLIVSPTWAQDDAPAIDPMATPTSFSESDANLSETQKLILDSVRESDPQVPFELVEASQILFDAGLFQDTRFLLGRLEQANLSDEEWLAIVDRFGSTFFLDVFSHMNTQPEGNRIARKVLSAARRAARSPERIQALIKNLSSSDRSAVSKSLRKLEALGESAVAEMISIFADDNREAEFDSVRLAINQLAPNSVEPLVGAAKSTNAKVKVESIRALARIDHPASTEVMMWSYLAPNHGPTLRQLAGQALAQRGVTTDPNQIEQQFFTRAYKYARGQYQAVTPISGKVTFWNWDRNQQRMVANTINASLATQLVAARHAASLYDINPASKRNRAMFLLTQLESFQRLAGSGNEIDADAIIDRLNSNTEEIDTILSQAIRLKMFPAAVACCSILKKFGNESLLHRYNGKPSPLAAAITSGDRYLQTAAFDTIRTIDPKTGYVGSSFVLDLAVNLAGGSRQPVALVGHRNVNEAQTYAANVGSAGLTGIGATSSQQLFKIATTNPDVEVIMISDSFTGAGYLNLIRQLRSDWRTREIPIALLYTDVDRGQQAVTYLEADDRFIATPFTTKPAMIATHVARLITRIKPHRVSGIDRQIHSQNAIDWISKITSDRNTYRFYEIGKHQAALSSLIFRAGFENTASDILSNVGTPSAQRQLVNFASQNSLPVDQRKVAAEAFGRSIKQGGTLLTTDEIQLQYDRYNASANEPQATQQILGSILDSIEANRGR